MTEGGRPVAVGSLQCVVLAGGLGTRMAPLTQQLPKVLIPVAGVPFAHHQLSHLAAQGVTEVVMSIGHHGDQVREYVGTGERWGLSVSYLEDGPSLLGTAGALAKGLRAGLLRSPFLTLYGDSFLPVAYRDVVAAFLLSGAPALMTVYRNRGAWDRSNVVYSSGWVRLYDKRPDGRRDEMDHIDYGLSVLTAEPLLRLVPAAGPADLADVYHRLSLESLLAGHVVQERFFEIGSPAGLADLEQHLRASHSVTGPAG